MILVVADDFTGAAELCGVALRRSLTAEVQTRLDLNSAADVVAVDTETRSVAVENARLRVQKIASELEKFPPENLFKKIDSLLRGPLLAEVEVLVPKLNLRRALLVPANPGLGRTIRDGRYLIQGKPLDQMELINDPEFPVRSAQVLKILRPCTSLRLYVVSVDQPLPEQGITIGEAGSDEDLKTWSKKLDSRTLAGGAAEFFDACLRNRFMAAAGKEDFPEPLSNPIPRGGEDDPICVFVSGSVALSPQALRNEFTARNIPVLRMPPELLKSDVHPDQYLEAWAEDAAAALQVSRQLMLTIGRPVQGDRESGLTFARYLAEVTRRLTSRVAVEHLCVDGGATASTLVRHFKWARLKALWEWAPGVVTMEARSNPRLFLSVKPGSYRWPNELLQSA